MKPNIEELAIVERKRETGYFCKVSRILRSTDLKRLNAKKSVFMERVRRDLEAFENELAKSGDARITCLDGLSTAYTWCLNELVDNAILHAHGNDPTKPVTVNYFRTDREVVATVEDEGPGFNFKPRPITERITPEEIIRTGIKHQRKLGLKGVQRYMNNIEYDRYTRRITVKKALSRDK
ncbi:ATP-binding protein [Candidatus Woesearchaeota archaeon]|nr:ATP-binding protein [Candidatus Woesearchaeota archaeon]MBW3014345.1 ATP-binding protein [Candidatus Woesearchaeota archaeon]